MQVGLICGCVGCNQKRAEAKRIAKRKERDEIDQIIRDDLKSKKTNAELEAEVTALQRKLEAQLKASEPEPKPKAKPTLALPVRGAWLGKVGRHLVVRASRHAGRSGAGFVSGAGSRQFATVVLGPPASCRIMPNGAPLT